MTFLMSHISLNFSLIFLGYPKEIEHIFPTWFSSFWKTNQTVLHTWPYLEASCVYILFEHGPWCRADSISVDFLSSLNLSSHTLIDIPRGWSMILNPIKLTVMVNYNRPPCSRVSYMAQYTHVRCCLDAYFSVTLKKLTQWEPRRFFLFFFLLF